MLMGLQAPSDEDALGWTVSSPQMPAGDLGHPGAILQPPPRRQLGGIDAHFCAQGARKSDIIWKGVL